MNHAYTGDTVQAPGGMAELHNIPFSIGRMTVSKAATMPSHHYHNNYELYYLYDGDRYYFIKDKTYHVQRGSLVLVKPYEVHSTINYGKSGYDRCLINFKRAFIEKLEPLVPEIDLFSCFNQDIHLISLSIPEQDIVEGLLRAMTREYRSAASGSEAFLQTATVQLLLIIARHASDPEYIAPSQLRASHKIVSEVAAYINNSYDQEITLASISEKFFISPCYFSRVFKRATGVSFTEYLNGVRIKEAQRLLIKTDKTIYDIAEAVGYKSASHFGRSFTAITGISPSEYRRKRGARGSPARQCILNYE